MPAEVHPLIRPAPTGALLAFEPVGTLRSAGWKFVRWLDVGLMQKRVARSDAAAPIDRIE